MTKKMWLVIALLVVITLAVSFTFDVLVFNMEVIALMLLAVSKTVLSSLKILALFFKQAFLKTLASLLSKRVLRPIYGIFGLTYLIKRVSKRVKDRVSPKITKLKEATKARWTNLPRLVRGIIFGVGIAGMCAMGYGIWIFVPLTMMVLIVSRVQTMWLDSVLRKKFKKLARKVNRYFHPHRKHQLVKTFRTARLRVLKQQRRAAAQLRSRISK